MQDIIWEKCSKSGDILKIEQDAQTFLKEFNLDKLFPLEKIEEWIFNCPCGKEDEVFNPILESIQGGTLADLARFNNIFREKLFAHVPQKALGGLTPIKYTLFLKNMRDAKT